LTEGFYSKGAIRDVEESEINPQYWAEKQALREVKKAAQAQRRNDKSTEKPVKKKGRTSIPATLPKNKAMAALKKQKLKKVTVPKPAAPEPSAVLLQNTPKATTVKSMTADQYDNRNNCPKCGAPLKAKTTSTGKNLLECTKKKWNRDLKVNEGCDYVKWL
jgi:hypothetical protein